MIRLAYIQQLFSYLKIFPICLISGMQDIGKMTLIHELIKLNNIENDDYFNKSFKLPTAKTTSHRCYQIKINKLCITTQKYFFLKNSIFDHR